MSEKYDIRVENGITVICLHEVADVQILTDALHKVVQVDVAGRRLWNFTKGVDITTDDLKRLISLSNSLQQCPSRSAFLVHDDLTYGIARMHEAYRSDEHNISLAFRDESEALEWLKAPDQ